MTIFEWQGNLCEMMSHRVAHFVETTREDWLDKRPAIDDSSQTRSVLEQIGECVRINRAAAAHLRGEQPEKSEWTPANSEEAQRELIASAKAYADAIRAQDESVFGKKFMMPWGEVDGAFLISVPIMNMSYHGGQINYVQMLYGDTEFHIKRD